MYAVNCCGKETCHSRFHLKIGASVCCLLPCLTAISTSKHMLSIAGHVQQTLGTHHSKDGGACEARETFIFPFTLVLLVSSRHVIEV